MKLTLFTANTIGNAGNTSYPNKVVVTSEANMKKAVRFDHVCAEYKDNYRKNEYFLQSDNIPMDVDNTHSENPEDWVKPEDMDSYFTDVAYVVVPSRHNLLPKGTPGAAGYTPRPRFHVYFITGTYTDAVAYNALKIAIQKEFPFFDADALGAARFLFGAEATSILWHDGSLTIESLMLMLGQKKCIPEGQRNATLSRFAGKVIIRFGVTEKAHQMFLERAAACEPPLPESELNTIWKSAVRFGNKITANPEYIPPEAYTDPENDPLIPDDFSDVGQARTFVENYGDEIAYTTATDYLRYNDIYWEESKEAATMAMIEHTDVQLAKAEALFTETLNALAATGVAKADALKGGKRFVESLNEAQSKAYQRFRKVQEFQNFVMKYRNIHPIQNALDAAKPMVLHQPQELDANPMLLNTPGGTYDLSQGVAGWKATDPKDYLTKVTAVVPSTAEAEMQLWHDALQTFFCGDDELIDYVQKICGMAIIGRVYVESMIIAYGDGSNGKSTFWNVLYKVLGSYAGNLSADALTVNCKRNVKPEMAELKGKRLIIAAELQEGTRLNTSVVKQLCSTDPIFAEKKFKAPFSFEPSHNLVLYTNHLPKVGAMDDGIWSRLMIIPFNAKLRGEKDVKNYGDYLFENAGEYILKWLIEGAEKLIAAGGHYPIPQCVQEAVCKYRSENDWLTHFLTDCCRLSPELTSKSGQLYDTYRAYCARVGEFTRSTSDFYHALEQKGIRRKRAHSCNMVCGVALISEDFT